MEKIRNGIRVINLDNHSPSPRKSELWPNVIRACISGGKGAGKTNAVLNILLHKTPLSSVVLVSRTAYQEKYLLLKELIENHNKSKKRNKIEFTEISLEELEPPENILKAVP